MNDTDGRFTWFLTEPGLGRLAQAASLTPEQARRALEAGLPLQAEALGGAQATHPEVLREAAAAIPAPATLDAALAEPDGPGNYRRAGDLLASAVPALDPAGIAGRAAGATGLDAARLRPLFTLTLPLLLGRLGAGAVPTGTVVAAVPTVVEEVGEPVAARPAAPPPPPPPPVTATTTQTVTTTRRGGFPWWLLLLPLLALGGCWLVNQNREATPAATGAATDPAATGAADPGEAAAPVATDFAVTEPQDGAEVTASGFSLRGTGAPGETYTVRREDQDLGSFTVGEDGTWQADVVDAAAVPGELLYTFQNEAGEQVGELPVVAVDAEAVPAGEFAVTEPSEGSDVPLSGFNMRGTGPAGESYRVLREGTEVGTFTVGEDGLWNVDVVDEAAPQGEQTYTVENAAGEQVATLPLNVVPADEANAGSDGFGAAQEDTAGTETEGAGDTAAAASLTVTEPQPGAEVPAAGFELSGTGGQPGETYQLYEDGVSVGTFEVDGEGGWTVDVAAPTPGEHEYAVLNAEGDRVASVPLNVVAATAAATCDQPLTVSLEDGEQVSAPFRFGGTGSAEAYEVRVFRGERQVGRTTVRLTPDCTWSYRSTPGGREGVDRNVRYEVRPAGAPGGNAPEAQVTLEVTGSGVNFNEQGEYVGPTN